MHINHKAAAKGSHREAAKGRRRRCVCILLLMAMMLAILGAMSGCVTEQELQEALAAQNDEAAEEAAEPLEPLEAAEETEEAQTPGIVEQLANMVGSRSQSMQIIGLLTILSLAPSILIMFTSFVRVIMVLSFTRSALGLQQMPPNQVLVGLALFLTLFILGPVVDEIKTEAYIP